MSVERIKFRRPAVPDDVAAARKRLHDAMITEALIAAAEAGNACPALLLDDRVDKRALLSYAQRYGVPSSRPDGQPWSNEELCAALRDNVVMPANRDALDRSMQAFAKWWTKADRVPHISTARKIIRALPGGSDADKSRRSSRSWEGPFCGPAGGAPPGTFPAANLRQTRAEERGRLAMYAPYPEGIIECAEKVGARGQRTRSPLKKGKRGPSGRKMPTGYDLQSPRWRGYMDRAQQEQYGEAAELEAAVPGLELSAEAVAQQLMAGQPAQPKRKRRRTAAERKTKAAQMRQTGQL